MGRSRLKRAASVGETGHLAARRSRSRRRRATRSAQRLRRGRGTGAMPILDHTSGWTVSRLGTLLLAAAGRREACSGAPLPRRARTPWPDSALQLLQVVAARHGHLKARLRQPSGGAVQASSIGAASRAREDWHLAVGTGAVRPVNPTSPLGAGGITSSSLPSSKHFLPLIGEGFTPSPPLGLDGGWTEELERPRWPKMVP